MRKKQTLLTGKLRQIVVGLFLCAVLALLALGSVQHFVSYTSVPTDGTRVTLASPSVDRNVPSPSGMHW